MEAPSWHGLWVGMKKSGQPDPAAPVSLQGMTGTQNSLALAGSRCPPVSQNYNYLCSTRELSHRHSNTQDRCLRGQCWPRSPRAHDGHGTESEVAEYKSCLIYGATLLPGATLPSQPQFPSSTCFSWAQLHYPTGVMCVQFLDFLSFNPPVATLVFRGKGACHQPHQGFWPSLGVLRVRVPSKVSQQLLAPWLRPPIPEPQFTIIKWGLISMWGRRLHPSNLSRLLASAYLCAAVPGRRATHLGI